MAYKFLQIPDFAKAGLNSDLMPWDLPGSFLTEIKNVRINNGKLSPFGGSNQWVELPVDVLPGYIHYVRSTTGLFWLIAGKDEVLAYDGSTFSDVSSVAGYPSISDEDLWQSCTVGNIPVLNHPQHYPQFWSPQNTASPMTILNWDATENWEEAGETCKIMRSHKGYLFALYLQGDTIGEVPDGVRWSTPADINGLPSSWDELDTTNVAGLTSLGGDGGAIIDGLTMRDAFVVYRENGVSIFDWIGGQFVWRIRNLATTVGLLSGDCIVEVKGVHYFMGDGDIYMNDGNRIESIIHNRLRRRFGASIDPDNYLNSFAIRNTLASEIWFCVPEPGHVYPTVAFIFNWRDDSWAIRDIPEAPFGSYGNQNSAPITWENIGGTWDTNPGVWAQRQATPRDDTIMVVTKPAGIGQSGDLKLLGLSTDEVESVYDTVIERVGFALEGLNRVTTITRVFPHMRGPGKVLIQIGSQDHPGAPVRWKQAVPFNPETDRKVDVRSTGELHCFRIFNDGAIGYWEVSGIDIEYVEAGQR